MLDPNQSFQPRKILENFTPVISDKNHQRKKSMKTVMKLAKAAFAVAILAVGALTASDAPAASTVRPIPTPRPRPAGPPALFASVGNGSGLIYEYLRPGAQNIFASGLSWPRGVAFDSAGNLFVGTSSVNGSASQGSVVKITPDGVQSTFATMDCCDTFPSGLAFDSGGNIFVNVLHTSSFEIDKFTPDGVQSTFADPPGVIGFGLAFDSAGNLCTGVNFESGPAQIWKYLPDGTPSVFATASSPSYSFNDLAFDRFGNLFVSAGNGLGQCLIVMYAPNGTESTFATGINSVRGLAFDNAGNLFVADVLGGNILKFTVGGTMTVFASGIAGPQFLAFRR
jgi:sugar lactone lactonase YvrE